MSNALYNKLLQTIKDFETATTDCDDADYLSDGEWLDVFYNLCLKIRNEAK